MNINELDRLIENLPAVPGIQGKEEYFNSVVLLLLIPIQNEYQIVFQKRCANIRQGGEISLPGGKLDPELDNTLEMTAVRETYEELGIPMDKIKIVGRMDTVMASMGATVDVFVGISEIKPEEMKINPEEVEKVFLMPVSYFKAHPPEAYQVMIEIHPSYTDKKTGQEVVLLPSKELGLPERYHQPWGGFKQPIYAYRTEEGVIWGITARIISDFVKKLK
ncbi:MAG: CoA pyrophosphatase [Clostridia bacterium]|nr:CoA pyrophosphatase [Clostridia bacterium]